MPPPSSSSPQTYYYAGPNPNAQQQQQQQQQQQDGTRDPRLPTGVQFHQMMQGLINFDWDTSIWGANEVRIKVEDMGEALTIQDKDIERALKQLIADYLVETTPAAVALMSKKKAPSELCMFLVHMLMSEEGGGAGLGPPPRVGGGGGPPTSTTTSSSISSISSSSSSSVGPLIDKMYPSLLSLMMVLQVHLEARANDAEVREDLLLRHTVMHVWRDILGVLDILLTVVQHAAHTKLVTLETPLDEWERILERKRGRVHAAEHALHVLATEEVRVNTALEPYRLRMEELHQSFDGDKQALQLTIARKAQAARILNWELDPRHMLAAHAFDVERNHSS
jgi:hypothetical protein